MKRRLIAISALTYVALLFGVWFYSQPTSSTSYDKPFSPQVEQLPEEPPEPPKPYVPQVSDIDVMQLHNLVNEYRQENGARTLEYSPALSLSAGEKCKDMVARNYWAHNAPDGTEPWYFIQKQVPRYDKAGENLAEGSYNSSLAMYGWKHSPTHNRNLLDPVYNYVGYGVCKSDNYVGRGPSVIVVQHFVQM